MGKPSESEKIPDCLVLDHRKSALDMLPASATSPLLPETALIRWPSSIWEAVLGYTLLKESINWILPRKPST